MNTNKLKLIFPSSEIYETFQRGFTTSNVSGIRVSNCSMPLYHPTELIKSDWTAKYIA